MEEDLQVLCKEEGLLFNINVPVIVTCAPELIFKLSYRKCEQLKYLPLCACVYHATSSNLNIALYTLMQI